MLSYSPQSHVCSTSIHPLSSPLFMLLLVSPLLLPIEGEIHIEVEAGITEKSLSIMVPMAGTHFIKIL